MGSVLRWARLSSALRILVDGLAALAIFFVCWTWLEVASGFRLRWEFLEDAGDDLVVRIQEVGLLEQQASFVHGAILGLIFGSSAVVLGWTLRRRVMELWLRKKGEIRDAGWGLTRGDRRSETLGKIPHWLFA